jgi:RNA polymerase sigma factor (sigma-70 family)
MNEKEMNRYIEGHNGAIAAGVNQLRRALREMGRKYSKDDMEDVAQELRIVMFKCLVNFRPYFHTAQETYIARNIENHVRGIIRTQCRDKHTKMYFSTSLSEPINVEGGYEELVNTIVDDRLPNEPRLDAVIFSDSLLALLDPRIRARILAWVDGMTFLEIAASDNVSSQAVQDSIRRGIDKLREIVDNHGKS